MSTHLSLNQNSLKGFDVVELSGWRMNFPWGIPTVHSEQNKRCYRQTGSSLSKSLQRPQVTRTQHEMVTATSFPTQLLIPPSSKQGERRRKILSHQSFWWQVHLVFQAWETPKLGCPEANYGLETTPKNLHCVNTSFQEIKTIGNERECCASLAEQSWKRFQEPLHILESAAGTKISCFTVMLLSPRWIMFTFQFPNKYHLTCKVLCLPNKALAFWVFSWRISAWWILAVEGMLNNAWRKGWTQEVSVFHFLPFSPAVFEIYFMQFLYNSYKYIKANSSH